MRSSLTDSHILGSTTAAAFRPGYLKGTLGDICIRTIGALLVL
jgi:hypothetical protein